MRIIFSYLAHFFAMPPARPILFAFLWSNCFLNRLWCTQWRSQPKIFLGGKMFDFRRATLFCLRHHFSKHAIIRYAKNLGGTAPFPPWLRLWMCPKARSWLVQKKSCNTAFAWWWNSNFLLKVSWKNMAKWLYDFYDWYVVLVCETVRTKNIN